MSSAFQSLVAHILNAKRGNVYLHSSPYCRRPSVRGATGLTSTQQATFEEGVARLIAALVSDYNETVKRRTFRVTPLEPEVPGVSASPATGT